MGILYENRSKTCAIKRRESLEYVAHIHKEIEIVYMISGQTRAFLDTKEYVLNEGDLFVAFPNKVHYYNTFSKEDSFLLIFTPEFFTDFSAFLLKNNPVEPVIRKKDLPNEICDLLTRAHSAYISDDSFRMEKVKGYINVFLADIIPCFEFKAMKSSNEDMLSSILTYCVEHYKDNINLDEMAKELHVSKYYISRLFGEKIKIGFNDYINMLRINDAKEALVKTNDSVTEIGINSGYNTIRSFNRAFLSQTGMQPREYRNKFSRNNTDEVQIKEEKTVKQTKEPEKNEKIFININDDFDCCF